MKLLSLVLPCIMAIAPTCTYSGSGLLIDEYQVSQVYLCAQNESEYKENISISVKTDGDEFTVTPTVNYGYGPSVFIGDFIGDGINQIFYSVDSGGSGAYSASQVISVLNGEPKTLYDSADYQNTATATLDGKTVKINYMDRTYYLDASDADLSGAKEVFVSDVNTVMPVYNGGLGRYQLIQFQKVYIDYTANNIGYLVSIIDISTNGSETVGVGTFANFDY